ncbi:MAG TPA: glucosamine-6-phosphate deaminase [Isosphaeraceae bacterium]|nr:glucosamine-6-phosphate deaminase [Isosphaeraceae bacterium]
MDVPPRSLRHAGMAVQVWPDAEIACRVAGDLIITSIRAAEAQRRRAVLGLATGSTPERVYAHLVRQYRTGGVSFRNVITYNLDEYYPISPVDPRSYRAYMHRHLFSQVDLEPNRAHVLDGTVPEAFVAGLAAAFDRWIEADGGLDLQLLGIGRNGHIGFNEPSDLTVAEALRLPTRLVELHPTTRADAARDFGGADQVIARALTLGIAPILAARSIVILATGAPKAEAVAAALTGPMTAALPASLLQSVAGKVTWILDEPAASGLNGPWSVVRGDQDRVRGAAH